MTQVTVTVKGRITLRKDILKHLGAEPGDKITIEKLSDGRIQVRAAAQGKISDVFGLSRKSPRKPLAIGEMHRIAARGWAGRK